MAAIYKGTVNDPTTYPPPSKTHGSYHWAFERLLSAGLVPLTAAAFITSGSAYPVLDGILGVSLVMHSHIGVRPFVLASLSCSPIVLKWVLICCHDVFCAGFSSILLLLITSMTVNSHGSDLWRGGHSGQPPLQPLSVSINSTPTTSVRITS